MFYYQMSRGWAAWFLWGTRAEGALCYGAGEGLTGGVVQTGTGKRVVGEWGAQIADTDAGLRNTRRIA